MGLRRSFPNSPWCKCVVAPRPVMRRAGKARDARIWPIFERRATQPGGMQRRSNADGLAPRAANLLGESPPTWGRATAQVVGALPQDRRQRNLAALPCGRRQPARPEEAANTREPRASPGGGRRAGRLTQQINVHALMLADEQQVHEISRARGAAARVRSRVRVELLSDLPLQRNQQDLEWVEA